MGQAKAKKVAFNAKMASLTPVQSSKNGKVKLFDIQSLDDFKLLTGRLPYEFEQMEYRGLDLADQMFKQMFKQMDGLESNAEKELYVGSWKDLVVEVNGRISKTSKEYFAIRLNDSDVVVARPSYRDTLTLTGMEAAFARFALSVNHISWYADYLEQSGKQAEVGLGFMRTITKSQAIDYYHMAMHSAGQLDLGQVYRYLD